MISMHGVPSSLIARNESWVRKQAQSLARNLPSNVEKADLIQVGLIAVAQASLGFVWEGDRDTPEAIDAFVRYARSRVKGAMLDELRQMDQLSRGQRRQIKVLQVARERWRASHGGAPGLARLGELCGVPVDEVARLLHAEEASRQQSLNGGEDNEHHESRAATARDEVEARVDTGIVLRRLERFFAELPERERQVIDAYLGIGLTPVQLAAAMNVTPSRVSQMFKASLQRIATHFGHDARRAADRVPQLAAALDDESQPDAARPWSRLVEQMLTAPRAQFGTPEADAALRVTAATRWG